METYFMSNNCCCFFRWAYFCFKWLLN